jgi:tRNA threonylcarbamoyladenosine modification (KEOPS) complex  Pcc1 subunit
MTSQLAIEWTAQVSGPDLPTHSERVMEALLKEEASCAIQDSAVSLNLADGLITLELVAEGADTSEAVAVAMSAIRAAIHAAGGSTPDWPTHDDVMRLEFVEMNTTPVAA